MKTAMQLVTPAMARKWLDSNTDNRRLRPHVVEALRMAWERGEWKATHQGIAFAKNGTLLDGQHRLMFISQLPEESLVPINVTTGCEDDLFGVIDQGTRRTLSDITGMSEGLAAVGRLFAKVQNGSTSAGLTPLYVAPFIQWAADSYSELVTFCPAASKIWSSSAVRGAAIFQMKHGSDADFVKISYDALVRSDIDAMPHAARVLMQQRMSGKIVSARTFDLFCRALRAFDSRRSGKIKTINIVDQAGTLAEVRAALDFLGPQKKGPAQAGPKVAIPVAKSTLKRAA